MDKIYLLTSVPATQYSLKERRTREINVHCYIYSIIKDKYKANFRKQLANLEKNNIDNFISVNKPWQVQVHKKRKTIQLDPALNESFDLQSRAGCLEPFRLATSQKSQ